MSLEDIDSRLKDRLAAAERLKQVVDAPRQERYPRQILLEHERAYELLEVRDGLIQRSGIVEPGQADLRGRVKGLRDASEKAWHDFVAQKKRAYEDFVSHRHWDDAAKELQSLLWAIGDTCDVRYQRFLLILEKLYAKEGLFQPTKFEGPGCIEDRQ
jgi:hypothetical protein